MRGRLRNSKLEDFWRQHLELQPASGLSIRRYCREHSLSEASFHSWRRVIAERDRRAPSTKTPTPSFLPVAVVDASSRIPIAKAPSRIPDPSIDIHLPGGRRLRVHAGCDRHLLADVLAILDRQSTREAAPC